MNLVELAEENLARYGEHVKIIAGEREYTNREMNQAANRLAHGLIRLGLKPGEKVLVMMMNTPQVLVSYQAILRAGLVIAPMVFVLGDPEIAHIAANSGARAIITSSAFLPKLSLAHSQAPALSQVIIAEDSAPEGVHSIAHLSAGEPDTRPEIRIDSRDLAVLLYTSGTTGKPKGVMLSHANLHANAVAASQLYTPEPGQVGLNVLPLSHSYGLTMMNTSMLYPNASVLMPWFDLEGACRLIERHRVFGFSGVPAIFSLMLARPEVTDRYDLSSLSICASGSAPLPLFVLEGFEKKFGCVILEGYGLSEASPVVSGHYYGRARKPGSVGQPVPGVRVKVVDENGREASQGQVGELIVKGPNVSAGYYNLPEETAAAFRGGWLYTGDMAYLDEDGYIFLVERKKDLIIRGGFNIVPRDVEEVLHAHPGVAEAAVVGVPDPMMGEEIMAFVVPQKNQKAPLTQSQVIAHAMATLARYKCPKYVHFVESLPRNAIGKVVRKRLREMAAEILARQP